jgi:hypothetical protein
MVLSIIFATIFYSYTMLAMLIPTPGPNQISEKHKSERAAFLNMSGYVAVEAGQEAVLECRVENLAKLLSVRTA